MTTAATIEASQISILEAIKVGDVVRFRNKACKGFGAKQVVLAIRRDTQYEIVLTVLPVNDKRVSAAAALTSQSKGTRGTAVSYDFLPYNAEGTYYEVRMA